MNSNFPHKLVKVLFVYNESSIPPRCRKPRTELKRDGEIVLEIPDLTDAEAPIALRATGRRLTDDALWRVDNRWFDGRLWVSVSTDTDGSPRARKVGSTNYGWPALRDVIDLRRPHDNQDHEMGYSGPYVVGDRDQTEASIRAWGNSILLVNGQCHRPTFERSYQVSTFGLGSNHGGTAVFSTSAGRSGREFSLLERDRALEEGTRVARRRGDTQSLPMTINSDVNWEVLMPEVLTVPTGLNAYRVHLNAVVRVPVEVPAAASQLEAIGKAIEETNLDQLFRSHAYEYADEIVSVLVDEAGDEDYLNSQFYDPGMKPGEGEWVQGKVVSFPSDVALSREIGVSEANRETVFSQSLHGYAALAAVKEIEASWSDALRDSYQGNLLADIDKTIELLNRFKERAKAILPPHTTLGA
ncbi:hypothetical protein [Paraburkholderia fungorum]|uniref:hypothetical protein n=1 Tax=Paraburkholderia fungorum TaxID=134537 RepID=UPI00161EC143|nr:hypothetical protein [Paraburkholderia fungorum]MBB5546561.1 hypothetical protein [Paraburkholderia fungorum]